ncbi:MAG: YkgJ family cysteine cluster protein [bacterium]
MLLRGPSAKIVPLEGDSFRFDCQPGLTCFGRCCSDLTLLLMPYDVLRLRAHLKLGSAELLERFTETLVDSDTGVPRVQLKMLEEEEKRCPFLGRAGCTVYDHRPGACRIFPIGRAAAAGGAAALGRARIAESGVREQFFLVQEEVCTGFAEEREWSIDRWLDDQGMRLYNAQNDRWLGVFTRLPTLADDPNAEARFSMFRTAGYDLDRFRVLITGEAFTSRFEIQPERVARLRESDEALLDFAVDWLGFALFGDQTIAPSAPSEGTSLRSGCRK